MVVGGNESIFMREKKEYAVALNLSLLSYR